MISNFLSNDLMYAIAMTLIHSLWQIAIIAVVLMFSMRLLKNSSSNHRYFVSLGALCCSVVFALVTFSFYYLDASNSISVSSNVAGFAGLSSSDLELTPLISNLDNHTTVIVNAWIIGSILFLLKFTGAYMYIKHIIKSSTLENVKLINALRDLKKKYEINRNVIIKESQKISSPFVMGYMKPIILFPIGLANQLSTQEVEAILAHELAHIKRHDFIFNMLQSFAEILFYYHPGIWYISSRMRFERENCCDDMAIQMTGNSVSYAKTLVKLQDLQINNWSPALAFSGNGSQFSQRILRILNLPINSGQLRQKLLAFALVFVSVFLFTKDTTANSPSQKESPVDLYIIEDCPQDLDEVTYYLDTIPDKKSFHIKKKTNEEELELEMENGSITKLKINGEEIPTEEYESYDDIILELSPNENRDIITVFPDCDDLSGRFYFKDKDHGITIKIDSMLMELKDHNFWTDDNSFHVQKYEFDDVWVDAFDDLKSTDIRKMLEESEIIVHIDSLKDLLPGKISWTSPIIEKDGKIIIQGGDDVHLFDFPGHGKHDKHIIKRLKKHDGDNAILFGEDGENIFEFDFDSSPEVHELLEKHMIEEKVHGWKNKLHDHKDRIIELEKFYEDTPHFEWKNHFEKDNIFFFGNEGHTIADKIGNELLKDRLIISGTNNAIELTGKHLKINGKKQASNIWQKYKELYEDKTGIELKKKSKVELEIKANKSKESYFRKLI